MRKIQCRLCEGRNWYKLYYYYLVHNSGTLLKEENSGPNWNGVNENNQLLIIEYWRYWLEDQCGQWNDQWKKVCSY